MSCNLVQEMTFQVSEYEIHQDTFELKKYKYLYAGKEFTITSKDVKEITSTYGGGRYIDNYNIATTMLIKIYGFKERIWGWYVEWHNGNFIEGNIAGIWHLKRVL